MHDIYGVDMGDPVLMHARSWTWLQMRLMSLIDHPRAVRLRAVLFGPEEELPDELAVDA